MENECESCGEYDTLFTHGLCFACIGKLKAEVERLREALVAVSNSFYGGSECPNCGDAVAIAEDALQQSCNTAGGE